jgi:DNA-binding NarL/FixJ family response regulator
MKPLSPPISILLVEDSPIYRHGIRTAIRTEAASGLIRIVAEAGTASEAEREARRQRPDVILLDLHLPDGSGLTLCRKLRQIAPQSCVIILTASDDDRSIFESVIAGAHGYLLKEIQPDGLINAIQDGYAGRPIFSESIGPRVLNIIRERQLNPDPLDGLASLSPQERRVLASLAEGQSNKQIATGLKLSGNTVKKYLSHAFRKLGVEQRSQAIVKYLRCTAGNNQRSKGTTG